MTDDLLSPARKNSLTWVIAVAQVVGFSLTSLCFLAAARSLLSRRPVLPRWALVVAAGLLVAQFRLGHLLEAAFSAYCVLMLGRALAAHIAIQHPRQEWWRRPVRAIALSSAVIHVLFAVRIWAEGIAIAPLPSPDALETVLILPLNFALFLFGAWIQLQLNPILSVEAPDHPLVAALNLRQRILTSKDFLQAGRIVGGDTLELVIRIPGEASPKLVVLKWDVEWERQVREVLEMFGPQALEDLIHVSRGRIEGLSESLQALGITTIDDLHTRFSDSASVSPMIVDFRELDPIIRRALEQGSEIVWQDGTEYVDGAPVGRVSANGTAPSRIAIPILFQGAVIGCLHLRFRSPRDFSVTDLARIRAFAKVVSFIAQCERDLSAIQQFSFGVVIWRAARVDVGTDDAEIRESIAEVAEILRDTISAEAVVIDLDIGFKRYIEVGGTSQIKESLGLSREPLSPRLPAFLERATSAGGQASKLKIVVVELPDIAKEIRGDEGSLSASSTLSFPKTTFHDSKWLRIR
ncbi:MAG TPA: hypothetical protein VJ302_00030 [Blastocatellia bacterium]|nr:hypothetical protein [Blastocatellia bacterium]